MDHYFPDVPGLGNVAVSRHAQARMAEDGIWSTTSKMRYSTAAPPPMGTTFSGEKGWRQGGYSSFLDAVQGSDAGKDAYCVPSCRRDEVIRPPRLFRS